MNIAEHGSREGVIKHIEALAPSEQADKRIAALEAAQLESAKAFLIAEIKGLDAGFNGVRVHAEFNAQLGARTFQANVIPMKLKL